MVYKVNAQSGNAQAKTTESIVLELVKYNARGITSSVAALTDSSGGTNAGVVVAASTSLVNAANSGTNLAGKATSETALGTVVDALGELYAKANAYATILAIDTVTNSGGGTAPDGTVGAVTVAVTAAATGAQAVTTNATLDAINASFYKLGVLVNKIATAQGKAKLALPAGYTYSNTVALLSTDTGTAADPGITKVAFDAELVKLRANVATLATALNSFNDGNTVATVIAV